MEADPRSGQVRTGLDVLVAEDFARLAGRRVGLITNHTGLDRQGRANVALLAAARDVELVALFSPEHGLRGTLDQPHVDDGVDEATGIPVFSLYGETRSPTPAMLEGIDTLAFDIQDAGTRFYTYIATLRLAMQAAARQGLRVAVLDRPNPIGGVHVAGPVTDPGREAFVACHPIAVRHGMTVGELARMFDAELELTLDLEVVRMAGWRRADYFDATGLRWVNPSPNLRSPTQALLYPGIGLLEATNLSVGRGTDAPFERLGAPWLDGVRLAEGLNAAGLPGVRFVPVRFTPTASTFEGECCGGVNAVVTSRSVFRPVRAGFAVARQLRLLFAGAWDTSRLDHLLRHRATLDALLAARPLDEVEAAHAEGLRAFRRRRSPWLLYD